MLLDINKLDDTSLDKHKLLRQCRVGGVGGGGVSD